MEGVDPPGLERGLARFGTPHWEKAVDQVRGSWLGRQVTWAWRWFSRWWGFSHKGYPVECRSHTPLRLRV